jgi:hypothetical protein
MPLTRREVVQTAALGAIVASLLKATPAVSAPAAGQGTKIVNLDDRESIATSLTAPSALSFVAIATPASAHTSECCRRDVERQSSLPRARNYV